jgi:2-oxoglutarate dehydrogenase E1 component
LVKEREKLGKTSTAIIRVEQIYPLPIEEINAALAAYPSMEGLRWVQEEPANQGAWPFIALNLPEHLKLGTFLRRVSRDASASPAAGSHNKHEVEQEELLAESFA